MKIRAHRLYDELRRRLAAHRDLLRPWSGIAYRVTTLDYPKPADILRGEGSYLNGGRWNAMGSVRAVYGSTEDTVAVAESRATADYAGIPYPFVRPRLLVAVELRLHKVLNLAEAGVRAELGVDLTQLREDDWRKQQEEARESFTQSIGRAAFSQGAEGLLIPSARIDGGTNVAYFPERKLAESHAEVLGSAQLEQLIGSK